MNTIRGGHENVNTDSFVSTYLVRYREISTGEEHTFVTNEAQTSGDARDLFKRKFGDSRTVMDVWRRTISRSMIEQESSAPTVVRGADEPSIFYSDGRITLRLDDAPNFTGFTTRDIVITRALLMEALRNVTTEHNVRTGRVRRPS